MKIILKLAIRNVFKNWRRSLITIAAIIFATTFSAAMRGMQEGTYEANIRTAVEMFTGFLQIQHKDYMDNPNLTNSFYANKEIMDALEAEPEIKSYTKRLISFGLLGKPNGNSIGTAIIGIDPNNENNISQLHNRVRQGNYISDEKPYDIVIGEVMLRNLKASIGDTVVILTSGFDGSTGNEKFCIAGTLTMGSTEMDAMTVLMHIEALDDLFYMQNRISSIAISLDDFRVLPAVKASLMEKITDERVVVLDWMELMPELMQSIEMDDASGMIYMFILIIIVAFGILNTVLISITERFKEFGIMLALGAKKSFLMITVFIETMFLTLAGIIIGLLIGYAVNLYYKYNPYILDNELGDIYELFGFLPALYASVDINIFIYTGLTVFVIALISFIYPAYKLYKLEALKGIRYT